SYERRYDHRDLVAILAVFLSVSGYQVGLFEPDRQQDVGSRHDGKKQVSHGHDRRRPKRQQPPDIEWMPHVAIEERSAKLQVRVLAAHQIQIDLAQSEQVKVIDQERAEKN